MENGHTDILMLKNFLLSSLVSESSSMTGTATILAAAKSKPAAKPKKKATKSHFPNMWRAAKQSSSADVEDLIYLHSQITGVYLLDIISEYKDIT